MRCYPSCDYMPSNIRTPWTLSQLSSKKQCDRCGYRPFGALFWPVLPSFGPLPRGGLTAPLSVTGVEPCPRKVPGLKVGFEKGTTGVTHTQSLGSGCEPRATCWLLACGCVLPAHGMGRWCVVIYGIVELAPPPPPPPPVFYGMGLGCRGLRYAGGLG